MDENVASHSDLLGEVGPAELQDLSRVRSSTIELGEALFHHGGWQAVQPLDATGAHMNNAYMGVTQLVDRAILPSQFRTEALERDEIWNLVARTKCVLNDHLGTKLATRVEVELRDDTVSSESDQKVARKQVLMAERLGPKGIAPGLSNRDIIDKWRALAMTVIDDGRREAIEQMIRNLEQFGNINNPIDLLAVGTGNPLEVATAEYI